MKRAVLVFSTIVFVASFAAAHAADFPKPYSSPCIEREDVFAFAQKPAIKLIEKDRYEITFAVKGNCDVACDMIDGEGRVIRHLGAGVLGANAPAPFQKGALSQKIYWNGKDDLERYVKDPAKLRFRVRLGLKPVFDKRLGGTTPKNIPGKITGIVTGPDGVYISSTGSLFGHVTLRKFDHDGTYIQSLLPPPSTLPEKKLGGMTYIEYEPGIRTVHAVEGAESVDRGSRWLPDGIPSKVADWQPVISGDRFFFPNGGKTHGVPRSALYWIHTDGSTDLTGIRGVHLDMGLHGSPRLAASPDGKWIYAVSAPFGSKHATKNSYPVVMRAPADGSAKAEVFLGDRKKVGTDNAHFNGAAGVDCDARGRVYVADHFNGRIQMFSPDGKYLKTIKVSRPTLVFVHKKTGAIYVQHSHRVKGKSVIRITKYGSLEDPKEELHLDAFPSMAALDSWSGKPRIWLSADWRWGDRNHRGPRGPRSVTVWEERGENFEKIVDFDADARKETGKNWFGKWNSVGCLKSSITVCDPTREKVYYAKSHLFDLGTGAYEGRLEHPGATDDMEFDKHGYMHAHFNPCFFMQGVGRFDPDRRTGESNGSFRYAECPYDYGIPKGKLLGILPVKDQRGAKGFQDGLGVNMQGEVAVQTNIYHVPKMGEHGWNLAAEGIRARRATGQYVDGGAGGVYNNYNKYMQWVQEQEKKGEAVYAIKRKPGIPLAGGTAWTFNRTGELRMECAVIAGDLMNGVRIDEDRALYFVNARPRLFDGKIYLAVKGGTFGVPRTGKGGRWVPFTGTLIKAKPDEYCRIMMRNAKIAMESVPKRPAEVAAINFAGDQHDRPSLCWVEGAEWLYAGASPIVSVGCSCYTSRFHLDWYKRLYVPEAYRHSIGVLDTNGNLIMHLGRYANFDTAPGGPKGCRPGDTDIGVTTPRFISGTDNYLTFEDWGERVVVLRLDYHAEETTPVAMR